MDFNIITDAQKEAEFDNCVPGGLVAIFQADKVIHNQAIDV